VSDSLALVRQARESLARALGAIQSTPSIPQELLDIAGVVAKGMSACHQMEKAGKDPSVAQLDDALGNVRSALGALQGAVGAHPGLMPAIEAVAGGLGPLVQAQRAVQAGSQQAAALDATVLASSATTAPSIPPPAAPAQQAAPVSVPPPPAAPAAPAAAPAPAPAAAAPASLGIPGPEAIPADATVIDVALGTHSASNFYKGLSGNDIIQHGGIFVATYKIPKSGSTVRLKVAMPGGYEFELGGVVTWIRDPVAGNPDAHPGFGARISHATVEGRDLIRRYVKNREPLFHDDL
jgi:Tfp pilus assembly protein PilZ